MALSAGGDLLNHEVCYDDAAFTIKGTHISGIEATASDASSGLFRLYKSSADADAQSDEFSTSGFDDNGDGTASINPAEISDDNGNDREGNTVTYFVVFTYTDANSCSNVSLVESFTINPQPRLNLVFDKDQDDATDAVELEGASVCNTDETYTVFGEFSEGNATLYNFANDGILTINTLGLIDAGDGTASFNARNAAKAFDSDSTATDSNHEITFSYTDTKGCSNEIKESIAVLKLPSLSIDLPSDIQIGTESDQGEYCVDTPSASIVFEGKVNNGLAGDSYFSFPSNDLSNEEGSILNFDPDLFHEKESGDSIGGLLTEHTIRYTLTSDRQGSACTNYVEEIVTVFPKPELDLKDLTEEYFSSAFDANGDAESFVFCEDLEPFTVQVTHDNVYPLSLSQYFVDDRAMNANVNGAQFTPLFWTEEDEDFVINSGDAEVEIFRAYTINVTSTDVNGCENTVEKVFEVYDRPLVNFEVNGECIQENIEFRPLIIHESSVDNSETSDYVLDDLIFDWGVFDGKEQLELDVDNDEIDPGDPTRLLEDETDRSVSKYIDRAEFSGLSQKEFNVFLTATYVIDEDAATTCTSIVETAINDVDADDQILGETEVINVPITYKEVSLILTPRVAFSWSGITESHVNRADSLEIKFNETEVDADKIKEYELFVDGISLGRENLDEFVGDPANVHNGEYYYEKIYVDNLSPGLYDMQLFIYTGQDCFDSLRRDVNIIPWIEVTKDAPYFQNFDVQSAGVFDPANGWHAERMLEEETVLTIGWSEGDSTASGAFRSTSWEFGAIDIAGLSYASTEYKDGHDATAIGTSTSDVWGWSSTNGGLDENGDPLVQYLENENSWIYSPAFDISSLKRPMIKFDRIYDFGDAREGVVIQFTLDDGDTWIKLGAYDNIDGEPGNEQSGINWFISNSVSLDPGEQVQNEETSDRHGWGGRVYDVSDDAIPSWETARHRLEDIKEYIQEKLGIIDADGISDKLSHVRFRFALASTSDLNTDKFGFAFDNFVIQERSNNVLIEEFISVERAVMEDEDPSVFNGHSETLISNRINELEDENTEDYILMTYHTEKANDVFEGINSTDPSARAAYYSIDEIVSVLGGTLGGVDPDPDNQDQGNLTWSDYDLHIESLRDPKFEIEVTADADATSTEILGTVKFKVLEDIPAGVELSAYVSIIESSVETTVLQDKFPGTYTGFGEAGDLFENVTRKLLPDGSGEFVKLTDTLKVLAGTDVYLPFTTTSGDTFDYLSFDWELVNIFDDSKLTAVVFIQNNQTKEIYQAVELSGHDLISGKNSTTVTEVIPELLTATDFSMYPNPTDSEVYIKFDYLVKEEMTWKLFDQTGRVYDQGIVKAGQAGFQFNTAETPSGLYFMSIRSSEIKFDFKKLLIVH